MNQSSDPLLELTTEWIQAACNTIASTPDPVAQIDGIDSWSINSDGSIERRGFSLFYSGKVLDSLFDDNAYWNAVEAFALSEEIIKRKVSEELNLSPSVSGTKTLREFFLELIPQPKLQKDQLIFPFSEISIAKTESFLSSLRSEETQHYTVWPITGMKASNPIELGDGYVLRALSDTEKLRLLSTGIIRPRHPGRIPKEFTNWFGLVHTRRLSKFSTRDRTTDDSIAAQEAAMESAVEDFLSCVSISADKVAKHLGGSFSAPRLEYGDTRMSVGRFSIERSVFLVSANRDPEVSDRAKEDLLFAWALLRPSSKQMKSDKALANAIRRYHVATTRLMPEDQLVDLMIAAESVYLTDSREEKKFRLSLNAAQWADLINEERHQIFLDFNKAYDMRSSIVHGQTVDSEEVKRVVEKVRSRISSAIKKFLFMRKMDRPSPSWTKLLFPVVQDPTHSQE